MAYNADLLKAANRYGKQYGVDPAVLIATTIVESGGRLDAVGDGGKSYGPYQMYQGGRLKTAGFTPQQAMNPYMSTRAAAQEFATYARKGYKGAELAVRAQRPADYAGYMRKINAALPTAKAYLAGQSGYSTTGLLNAPVEGAEPAASVQLGGDSDRESILKNAILDRSGGSLGKRIRAALVAKNYNEQPNSTDPLPATNNGSARGGTGTVPKSLQSGEAYLKSKVGTKYAWGGGHGGISDVDVDCSGLVSQFLMRVMPGKYKSAGTTMTLFPKMKGRPASKDAPIAVGFRGMGKGARGEHMGIRVNGVWYSAGGRGNSTVVVGDDRWDHVVLP